jgi:hypothetical protein
MKRKVSIVLGVLALLALLVPAAAAQTNITLPAGEVILLDDFEEGNFWAAVGNSWDQWGNHNWSLTAELTDEWSTAGPNAGDWAYDKIPEKGNQATFFCDQLLVTDWTGVKYVVADVKNPSDFPIILEFNSQSTDGWSWTATQMVGMFGGKDGIKTIVFDLGFGLLDGNNAPMAGIPGPDKMKRAMITVRSAKDAGHIFIDNIRLIK